MLDTEYCKHTHSEYVILIAFPLEQWLHEHTTMLHDTYLACFVMIIVCITILNSFLHHLYVSSIEYVRCGFWHNFMTMVDHIVLCVVWTEKCWVTLLHKGSEFRSLLSVDSATYFTVSCEWLTLLVPARRIHSFHGNNSEDDEWIILVKFLSDRPSHSPDLSVAGFSMGVLE
jgi:hypothetical protein